MAEVAKRPPYYPVYLDLWKRNCLVLGGGAAAAEKALYLAGAGADVTVIATEVDDPELLQMGGRHQVRLLRREFSEADLDGVELVIDASGDDPQGVVVAAAARRRRILVNVLDRVPLCDFIAPAMVRRGSLQVAISTGGRSPFMASHIRDLVEQAVGPEYAQVVDLVGDLRDRLRASGVPLVDQLAIYQKVPGCGAVERLRAGDIDGARAAIEACAGTAGASPPGSAPS